MFLHKWGTLRILQAPEHRYNHSPKNIETIKVVKRQTDSIIYKSYSSQISKTMVARQKRIERMNTMPNIKLNIRELTRTSPTTTTRSTAHSTIRERDGEEGSGSGKVGDETAVLNGAEKKRVRRDHDTDRTGADDDDRPEKHKYKVFSRMITSPVLELDEQQSSST